MIFSVIIPCYNCVKTLERTVESIRVCGLSDYEILLIDDGSNDGTAELCDRLCGKNEEIRCVHQSNAGVSAARNRGIDEARGEYIWFVDSDDTVDEDSLRGALKTALLKKPDMLLFGMSFDYYNHGKMYLRENLNPPSEGMLSLQNLKDDFDEFYNCNALTPVWNKLFRIDLLKKCGTRFREDMFLMEDYLFVLELLPFCKEIYSLRKPIYRYRQAEDERSAYRRLQRIENLAEYMQPFEQGLKTLGIPCEHVENLYSMLLKQRMYYASFSEIRSLVAQHNRGKYCRLKQPHPLKIYLCSRLVQIRHKLAVAVKSSSFFEKTGRTENMTKRISYIDNTRAFLIALVVLGHILNYANPKYDIVPYVLVQQFLDSFHMPAFFILSGMLTDGDKWRGRSVGSYFLHKAKTLLVPYLFFECVAILYKHFVLRSVSIAEGLRLMLTFRCNIGADWFLPAMFAACALYCLYIRFPKKLAWGIGGGLLCIALRFMPAGHVPTLIFRGALGFVFMLAGNLLNKPLTEFKTWKICVAFALTAAAAAMYLKLSINNSFFSGKLDNPVLYLVSGICGTYFVMGIARLIPWKWVGCIGQNALTIMGTHQLVLYTVKIGSSPLWVVGSFLLIAAVEAVLIFAINRFCPMLVGKKRKEKSNG